MSFRSETIEAVKAMGITAKELGFGDADALQTLCIAKSKQYDSLTNALVRLIKELDIKETAREIIPEEFWDDLEIAEKKYKIVKAKVSKMVYAEVLVAVPEDASNFDIEDALDISYSNQDALDDYITESDDWEYEDYDEEDDGLTEAEIMDQYDQSELWNYDDFM